MADRFPSPFDMPTPPGAEGWQDLYAYSSVFSEDRREYEESMFWFMDGVHTPEVAQPWDATILEFAIIGLSQYNTRHYVIPPALGVDIRILNGYMYLSPVGVADPDEIGARVPEFAERAGYYFQNWDRLYQAWMPKVRALIDELEAVSFDPLPDREDMAVITEGRGTGSGLDLLSAYHRLVHLTLKLWHYHFEFLNLGYAAYLDFFGCCWGWPDGWTAWPRRCSPGCAATRPARSGWRPGMRPSTRGSTSPRAAASTTATRCGWRTPISRWASCGLTSRRCSGGSRWKDR
jgi:pyruvate, water dikinase